jgi:hypothetical protein
MDKGEGLGRVRKVKTRRLKEDKVGEDKARQEECSGG